MEKRRIVVTCLPYLADVLEKEILALGYQILDKEKKAVTVKGDMTDVMKLNYYLRCANRVLYHFSSLKASGPGRLKKLTEELEWEQFMEPDVYFSVDSFVKNKMIRDTRYANLVIKDAIADRFRKRFGKRPDSGPGREGVVIFLYWVDDEVKLYFDTSGATLSKHGYRVNPWKAPMQENLAAAVIYSTAWDGMSHFINPMCGSGTLAIEAAWMAYGIYPGRLREHYAFKQMRGFDMESWLEIKRDAMAAGKSGKGRFRIIATDRSAGAVAAARQNARKAGVDNLIEFEVCDFRETKIPEGGPGVVVMNPEYGKRMGEKDHLEQLYEQIGDFFKKKCEGYKGYVFTGEPDLAKKIGLRTSRRIPFLSAKIESRLLEYIIYAGSQK
jgi:putative N6-adenine-specific DNA methylase